MVSKTEEEQVNRLESQVENGGGGAWEYICLVRKLKLRRSDKVLNFGLSILNDPKRRSAHGPEEWTLYEDVAIAAMDCQCLDVAKDSVKVLQKKFPGSRRVGRLEAMLLEANGSWTEAENAYSSLLEENPLDQDFGNRMDSKRKQPDLVTAEEGKAKAKEKGIENLGNAKVIDWEDYEQELARLCSLSSAVNEAKQKKLLLQQKLESVIQVETESLSRSNELDKMRERLESLKFLMGNMSMKSKVAQGKVERQEEQLTTEIRSLLVAGSALSGATKHLQEYHRSLAGERGYLLLKKYQKSLRLRQQYMVSQVSLLYPVKLVVGQKHEQELESFTSSIKPGAPAGSKPLDHGSLTIACLHLTGIPSTKMSFFSDKKEAQRSATALGYVAHAVTLIASYLQVPLRYPLRLGGSRSYVRDYAPSIEPSSSESILNSSTLSLTNGKPVEFPLFLEGQDSTRAAYAVFLLNKDLEQLLNYIGVKSLGPRHILANLKELLKTILSPEYIDT